jgi:hypothetical protein
LSEQGYGNNKGIGFTIIASCPFDNIINIVLFGICKSIAFQTAFEKAGLFGANHSGIGTLVGLIILQIVVGILGGALFGVFGYVFKPFHGRWWCVYFKTLYCLVCVVGFMVACE